MMLVTSRDITGEQHNEMGLIHPLYIPLPHIYEFWCPWRKAFENIVEKGENAGHQHFLLFPQCFLPYQREINAFQPL